MVEMDETSTRAKAKNVKITKYTFFKEV